MLFFNPKYGKIAKLQQKKRNLSNDRSPFIINIQKSIRRRLLEKFQCGMIFTLLGAGTMTVSFFMENPDNAIWVMIGAIILLGIGIGYLSAFFLGRRFLVKEMEAEENASADKAE